MSLYGAPPENQWVTVKKFGGGPGNLKEPLPLEWEFNTSQSGMN